MRKSFTPEEVTRIEDKAYEVGVSIGKMNERERIIALLEANLRPVAASGDDPESFGWREGMGYAIALIKEISQNDDNNPVAENNDKEN